MAELILNVSVITVNWMVKKSHIGQKYKIESEWMNKDLFWYT